MRWPWQRHKPEGAEYTAAALAQAQERLRRAERQTEAIVRRADEVLNESRPADIVSRVAAAFRMTEH